MDIAFLSCRCASGRERLRVGVGVLEDVVGVIGPGGEREALAELAVLDDDCEPVAVPLPEERDGDPVALAVVELLQVPGRGELGHRCLLLLLRSAGLHALDSAPDRPRFALEATPNTPLNLRRRRVRGVRTS